MSYIKHRADESLEDYLETILMLQKSKGQVRSIDIANEMNSQNQVPARDKAYCRVFMIVLPYYIPLFYSLLLFYVRHHYI